MVTALRGGETMGMGNTKRLMLGVGAPGERRSWVGPSMMGQLWTAEDGVVAGRP